MPVDHARVVEAQREMWCLDDARRLAATTTHTTTHRHHDTPHAADKSHKEQPLSYDALRAILSQKIVNHTKNVMSMHRQPDVAAKYVARILDGDESLTDMALELRIPSSMLARVVLEQHLGKKKGKEVGKLIKEPASIGCARLRAQVADAVANDAIYGPSADAVKRLLGIEYELILQQHLAARRIPFVSEEELRTRGEAKTPDALLPVPILVDGHQVHWIDSKATFGDVESHSEYAAQFCGYVNRFAGGLVIYWFGYDESIEAGADVLVRDDFPRAAELMSHFVLRA